MESTAKWRKRFTSSLKENSMTTLIILITAILSFAGFSNRDIIEKYKFNPFRIKRNKEWHRWISYGFIHADMNHLIFNMLSLYFAGQYCELIFTPAPSYILFYLSAIVVSGIADYHDHKNNPYYSAVGASGAVNAVLFSLVLFEPWGKVDIFMILPMPFIVFAILYLAYSWYMAKRNGDNIGHLAHISGAIYGIIATIIYVPNALQTFLVRIIHPSF